LGTKLIPKLRSGAHLTVGIDFSVTLDPDAGGTLEQELRQVLKDLDLETRIRVEYTG
jgi:hypothetical protein